MVRFNYLNLQGAIFLKKKLFILLSFVLLLTLLSEIPKKAFANERIIEIEGVNSKFYMDRPLNQGVSLINSAKTAQSSSNISVEKSRSTRIISEYAESLFFWLDIYDSDYNPVTGIKVSRIEMIQSNTVVARANDVESYSINGHYRTRNLEVVNKFQNSNGENNVDLVLYLGSKEVARLKNYKIHVFAEPILKDIHPYEIGLYNSRFNISLSMLNVAEEQKTDIYLVDENGFRITKTDKIIENHYNSNEKSRYIEYAISFIDENYLSEDKSYEYILEVDGQVIESFDVLPFKLIKDTHLHTTYHSSMPDLKYRVLGVNLLDNNPYKLFIEQDGKVVKEINNVMAKFNEEQYTEEINVDLLPEYFENYGGMYKVTLFNANNKQMSEFDFLVQRDDTSEEENDIINPFEGFKVFDKVENIEPNKTWRVEFNKAVDSITINNGNTYVINKRTGKSVEVKFNFENEGTILTITPTVNFVSGEAYSLIIDKRVKSDTGKNLSQPAAIEFTVK